MGAAAGYAVRKYLMTNTPSWSQAFTICHALWARGCVILLNPKLCNHLTTLPGAQITDYAHNQGKSREHIFAKIWMLLEDDDVAKEYNIVVKATLLEVGLTFLHHLLYTFRFRALFSTAHHANASRTQYACTATHLTVTRGGIGSVYMTM